MLIRKGSTARVPFSLQGATGTPVTGVIPGDVLGGVATVVKASGAVSGLVLTGSNFFEVDATAAPGLYHVALGPTQLDVQGELQVTLLPDGAAFVPQINTHQVVSPFFLCRAVAVKSQVARVVFCGNPRAKSPAGVSDALNPSNYTFSVLVGQAGAPRAVGVDHDLIEGPDFGVLPGEVGVDVHVDRPLVLGIQYFVVVTSVVSAAGDLIGAPNGRAFAGIQPLSAVHRTTRRVTSTDIQNDPGAGRWTLTPTGDLGNHAGTEALRKRLLRRLVTPAGAFAHLPGYGVGMRLKEVASIAQLQAFRSEAVVQLRQEPEVVDAEVGISQSASAPEVVEVQIRVTQRAGGTVEFGAAVDTTTGILL